jgi:hypothetical protein
MESKGATGILVCILCQNCLDHKRIDQCDGKKLVASTELDITKFQKHDRESIADAQPL